MDITESKKTAEALRVSEERFSLAFKNSPNAITINRLKDGKIIEGNDSVFSLLGYTHEELIGKSTFDLGIWEDPKDRQKLTHSLGGSGYVENEEYVLKKKNGTLVPVNLSASLIMIEGQACFLCSFIDLSERKKAEEEVLCHNEILKGINNILSLALTSSTEKDLGLGCLDIARQLTQSDFGFIGEINENGLEDIAISNPGWDACNVIDSGGHKIKPISFIIHGLYGKVLTDGKPLLTNHPLGHKHSIGLPDGHPPLESFLGVPLINKEKTTGIIALANRPGGYNAKDQQIIETLAPAIMEAFLRKRAEEELKDSERKLRSVMDATQESIYMFDLQGNFILANAKGLKRLNIPNHEIIRGRHISEFMAAEYADIKMAMIKEVIRTGDTVEFDDERKGKIFHHHYFPVFDTGKILSIVAYSRDITERVAFENELKEKNLMLMEINDTKDKFFSIIAHDMKNPFISLLGASEMLHENAAKYSTERIVTMAKILNDSAHSGYNMLLNMLDWARSQAGSLSFQPRQIKLKEYIGKNLANLLDTAHGKEIKLDFDISADLEICADQNMLGTVLRNLVTNALKFTPRGGEVKVGSIMKKEILTLFVKDNGVGIDKADIDKLFRSDIKHSSPGTEHEMGTGLGLLLCKEFVERHSGEIWVESEKGKGTVFYFTLPCNNGQGKKPAETAEDKKKANGKITILPKNGRGRSLKKPEPNAGAKSEIETLKRIHELEVHQIELELQSGQIMMEKLANEEKKERFIELFDYAPSGYLILTKESEIIDLNRQAGEMLGREPQSVRKGLLGFFISDESKPAFNDFIEQIFKTTTAQSCTVALETGHKTTRTVFMTGILSHNPQQCLVNMFDPIGTLPEEK